MKWLKRAAYVMLALAVASVPAYWWLFIESHRSPSDRYAVDIAEVRRLANVPAGEKPHFIRVETVAHLSAPELFIAAGDGWRTTDLPVSSYELIYAGRTAVVDTALDSRIAKDMSAVTFDAAAYLRMSQAMARSALIVVTHEHPDHIGGLLAQPNLEALLATTRLTREQIAVVRANLQSGSLALLHLNPHIFDGYRPLEYGRYQTVAPGVVLIKAPGHTPGSQMVYVQRADGRECLFLGDVAWQMRNIDTVREKARFVTWLADENRGEVREELAGLAHLHVTHPELHMMPGHDAAVIRSFLQQGLLTRGF